RLAQSTGPLHIGTLRRRAPFGAGALQCRTFCRRYAPGHVIRQPARRGVYNDGHRARKQVARLVVVLPVRADPHSEKRVSDPGQRKT
ncbi:MAG TPA: hypothetical protein VMU96_08060, partial [Casimicrobiaceae bacterium]|nr:hypothetical protein [Casimicrobiaceae bacterium]